jgi:hypothetical protein
MSNPNYDPYEWVRKSYGVPVREGARVEYTGQGRPVLGTVTGVDGGHIMIRLDEHKESFPYHPTWELRYLDKGAM